VTRHTARYQTCIKNDYSPNVIKLVDNVQVSAY
jgi:hypothetical protein